MAILDFIAIAGLFIPVVGWVASIGAMGGSFLLAIGIGALEVGAEYFKEEHWSKQEAFLLAEAQKEVKKILANGTPVEVKFEDRFEITDTVLAPSVSQAPANTAPPNAPNQSASVSPDIVETSEPRVRSMYGEMRPAPA
jgi:hypothetical protein